MDICKLLITVAGYISHHTDELYQLYTEGEGGQQLIIRNVLRFWSFPPITVTVLLPGGPSTPTSYSSLLVKLLMAMLALLSSAP